MTKAKEAKAEGVEAALLPIYISELHKIDQLKSCLKCGDSNGYSYNLKRRYCNGYQRTDGEECEYAVVDNNQQYTEHLHVACEKCGHPQLAACHDYTPPPTSVEATKADDPEPEEGAVIMPWDVMHIEGALE